MCAWNRRIALLAGFIAVLHGITPLAFTSPIVNIGLSFLSSAYETNTQATPPDANGAIGPQHFVEFINGTVAMYTKADGANVLRESDIDFWANAGVSLASDQGLSDPRVIYDPVSQRWFASQIDFDSTTAGNGGDVTLEANDFLIAFSTTSDPTADQGWHGFRFRSDPTHGDFADFPTLGVDSNAVYLSGNMFKGTNNNFGPNLVSFPKGDLLNSNFTTRTYFGVLNPTNYGWVLQPAICFDASTNGTILSVGDIGSDSNFHSNLFVFHVLGAGTPNATLSTPVQVIVDPYVCPFNADLGVPQFAATQPDDTQTLQANDPRFAAKVYNVGGVLYAAHNTEFNNLLAIRWYRIAANNGALLEQGTISDTDLDLFFPSIDANSQGVVVIGCNGSSLDTFVSSFGYVGQTANGVTTFGNRMLLQSGLVSYHDLGESSGFSGDSRWGDYSATSIDPTDPTQFWTIQMIPTDIGLDPLIGILEDDIWSTWITQLQIVTLPQLNIASAGTNALISWPTFAASFQLQSNTNLATTNWAAVGGSLTTNGSQISTLVPISSPQNFFRLQQ